MDDTQALLVVERGPVPAMRFPLTAEQTTIGRSTGNTLVLADPEVSRRHVRVVRRADGYAAEDIGSTNGTFVNGQRITHLTLLQDGDTIDLGDTVRLRFLSGGTAITSLGPEVKPIDAAQPAAEVRPAQPPATYSPKPAAAFPADSWAEDLAPPNLPPVPATRQQNRGRAWLLGCGLPIALLLVCAGTFLILDAYDQGRLLYCGPVAPIFQLILGPFGFAPICP